MRTTAGELVRLDPFTVLEAAKEGDGHLVPFLDGDAGEWDGDILRTERPVITAIGAGTTYPDYKPAPFIVAQDHDGVDMVTIVTEGIFSYCGAKVKIDTDRYLGPEAAPVRVDGEAVGHVMTAEYGSQMLSLGGVHHLTGGSKKEGRVTCDALLRLCNRAAVTVSIDGGAEVVLQAGKPPVVNGVEEHLMRVGCGSATIGMFAKQWHGLVDEVVVVDDHITGVLSEHQAGKLLDVPPTGIKILGHKSTPGRYFRVAEPGTGWGGTNIEDPLTILGPWRDPAWPGLRLLMVSTTGEQWGYYELNEDRVPVTADLPDDAEDLGRTDRGELRALRHLGSLHGRRGRLLARRCHRKPGAADAVGARGGDECHLRRRCVLCLAGRRHHLHGRCHGHARQRLRLRPDARAGGADRVHPAARGLRCLGRPYGSGAPGRGNRRSDRTPDSARALGCARRGRRPGKPALHPLLRPDRGRSPPEHLSPESEVGGVSPSRPAPYDREKSGRLMRIVSTLFAIFMVAASAAFPLRADDLTGLARLDAAASHVVNDGNGIALDLALSQPVPYRAFLMNDPTRLVLDFSEVDFGASRPKEIESAAGVTDLDWGPIRPGWSRIVAALDGPYRISSAEESVAQGDGATIRVRLQPVSEETFAELTARALAPEARWSLPAPAAVDQPKRRQVGDRPLTIVLDPGHGGIDPGAEADHTVEAHVMLAFARELAEVLRRAGMTVILTRDEDVFVPLETRISIARASVADVFLSLHADALAEGEATGATVYELADEATDAASARLAERHDRADLLAGIDLTGQDDLIASVMMDMARAETQPRAARLARDLVKEIRARGGKMHRHPIQGAAFSVLKSPDIPSLLLEVGFLSSPRDRARLADPVWRAMMQEAIRAALSEWAVADAAEAELIRQ